MRSRLVISPRHSGSRLQIVEKVCEGQDKVLLPSLDHLSAGQSILLNLAISIVRYGDLAYQGLDQLGGIVLIDEVDAHLHVTLQRDLLPELISLLPRTQFILTSHSPIFLLGMDRHFGADGFEIREMPSGKPIRAADFSEYEEVLRSIDVNQLIERSRKPCVVFVEGPSDKILLETAWKKLREGDPPFEVVDAFDCFFIQNICTRETVFRNSPGRIFIGLLDFDDAYDCWARVERSDNWEEFLVDPADGMTLKNKKFKAYLSMLPVPKEREQIASVAFGKRSCLSIEFLFGDEIITRHVRESALPNGGKAVHFDQGAKVDFAKAASDLPRDQFAGFEALLRLLEKLVADAAPSASAPPQQSGNAS